MENKSELTQESIQFDCECCEDYYNASKEFAIRTAKEQTPHWAKQEFAASFRHYVRDDNNEHISSCLYSNIDLNYCPACGRKLSEVQAQVKANESETPAD